MVDLMEWVRSRLRSDVDGVWCVRCQARQTVRRVRVVTTDRQKRLVGECRMCGSPTSKYI